MNEETLQNENSGTGTTSNDTSFPTKEPYSGSINGSRYNSPVDLDSSYVSNATVSSEPSNTYQWFNVPTTATNGIYGATPTTFNNNVEQDTRTKAIELTIDSFGATDVDVETFNKRLEAIYEFIRFGTYINK